MNKRQKGARGEREWAKFLTFHGFPATRGQQFSGSEDSPDVRCHSLPTIHFEVKRVQALNLKCAMAQAVGDCGGKMPIVAHRIDNAPWLITMKADDFMTVVKESALVSSPQDINA